MITQPEVLNKLEQLFPEGFYVLPSSVHEVLIVPDNGEMELKMLGEMVREVNKNRLCNSQNREKENIMPSGRQNSKESRVITAW